MYFLIDTVENTIYAQGKDLKELSEKKETM